MATIHMVLQGKGGVGKSLVASVLAQYFRDNGSETVCVDTDPVNATLAGYEAFGAIPLDIMNGGDDVDSRQFDRLVEAMLELPEESQMVIDNGAATFLPFCSYLAENAVFHLLKEQNLSVHLHSVVTGGQAIRDTLHGLESLFTHFEGLPVTIWLNPYFGAIRNNGREFEDFKVFKKHLEAINAVVRLPEKRKDTFGKDLEKLLGDRRTFAEALEGPEYPIMVRQRLRMIWSEIRAEIDKANL